MNVYIEYSSYNEFEKDLKILRKKIKDISKVYVVYNGAFDSKAYYLLVSRKIKNVEYIIKDLKLYRNLIRLVNSKIERMKFHLYVSKPLDKWQLQKLDDLSNVLLITDTSGCQSNLDYYQKSNYIVYNFLGNEDNILSLDYKHRALFSKNEYQCISSLCLGKNIYLSKDKKLYFCPHHLDKSYLCDLSFEGEEYLDQESFKELIVKELDKRKVCKRECSHYKLCKGGCPLMDDCSCLKETIEKIKFERHKDLKDLHYSELLLEIKCIAYGRDYEKNY